MCDALLTPRNVYILGGVLKRYNEECPHTIFQTEYKYNACYPDIKFKIFTMAMNGSGIRDTARVLGINKDTVIDTLKKKNLGTIK